ncbi:alpha/beta hydrolase [Tranquillimonas alkanivorans]|uniref:Phospholipase/carboxylesterase n=1 Tax=Tranquillimonas alkanivorans TaxID=441119 RepID=A0A1I5R834_9RHOB|nr:alpha/beta fold hydrolase [Tranquillimonas alkanivorans]SFP54653.1 phospholipase/carboxylesterase [Tranquillimonas alkanivorans]
MTRVLDAKRQGPPKGEARQVVVFLHGYGANGDDLLGLAEPLAPHMPGTAFIAPDAPERCVGNPMGYQWFPIPWLDGSPEEAMETSFNASVADLDAFLDGVLEDEGVTADRLVLFGFSQGTMMSLHVAPRRSEPVAAVVGFSGRMIHPEALEDEVVSTPPVLLIHGDQDDVVPPQSLPEAAEALQGAGFDVYAHVMKGTAHGIAPDGLSVAVAFMRERLGLEG